MNFQGGKIQHSLALWLEFSSDPWVADTVQGKFLFSFHDFPSQCHFPPPLHFSQKDTQAINDTMSMFVQQQIVERAPCDLSGFCSNIFPSFKKDGSVRIILNLKYLNEFVEYYHFKMETLRDILPLITHKCFFASLDLKHAYFSVPICREDRSWLKFSWNGLLYQFTCLPQGFSSSPRLFTKLLKVPFSHFRALGILTTIYIDDCLVIAASKEKLIADVSYIASTLDQLGFTINLDKSEFQPSHEIEFLGFVLNSIDMTLKLTQSKANKIRNLGLNLLHKTNITIRDLAVFIGNVVAAGDSVLNAPLHYKYLEVLRNDALQRTGGDYDAFLCLDDRAKGLIAWWTTNIHTCIRSLLTSAPDLVITTDASMSGWGACAGDNVVGGHWADSEKEHINILELKAVLLGLKTLFPNVIHKHIRIKSDNTTVVASINNCGSIKRRLLDVTEEVFEWAHHRNVTLSAEYLQGSLNVTADLASREKDFNKEWSLMPTVFNDICRVFRVPTIDLFASRINTQLPLFYSWKPDPDALGTDAFSFNWNTEPSLYAFPPFRIIKDVIRKLREDEASMLAILPLWSTQPWFAEALRLLQDAPRLLPRGCLYLPQDPLRAHPIRKLQLAVWPLSGNLSEGQAFRQTLQTFYSKPGMRKHLRHMGNISKHGTTFVYESKLIHFLPL